MTAIVGFICGFALTYGLLQLTNHNAMGAWIWFLIALAAAIFGIPS